MTIMDLEKAFQLINENFNDNEVIFSASQSEMNVNKIEKVLEITLPKSYRLFIQKVGHGGPGSIFIPGIPENCDEIACCGVAWGVLNDRKTLQYPHGLIKMHDIGNGDSYCLDTSQMNDNRECPVVVWPIGGYEQTPVLEKVAEDFGEFFLNMVRQQIEYKKSQLL